MFTTAFRHARNQIKLLSGISIALLALAFVSRAAEQTTGVNKVHVCCKGCVNAIQQAVAKVPDATAKADPDTGTVTLTAKDAVGLQKAADALVAAGFFGQCADTKVKLEAKNGAQGKKVRSIAVEGAHLCCGECVAMVDKAVASVPGAQAHTAKKGAKSFEVSGDFNDRDFMEALQKKGLSGRISK